MIAPIKLFKQWWKTYGAEVARVFIPEFLALRAYRAGYRAGYRRGKS